MSTFYHFTGDTLRNGEPIPPIGEWIEVSGEIVPCKNGLHASKHPFDSLTYAPGHMLHRVELGGEIVEHGDPVDKVAARRRKIVATIDAEKLLRIFARRDAARDAASAADWDAAIEKYRGWFLEMVEAEFEKGVAK